MRNGRPLRFVTVTIGGWTVLRVAMLWPDAAPGPRGVSAIPHPVVAAAEAMPVPTRPLAAAHKVVAFPRRADAAAWLRLEHPVSGTRPLAPTVKGRLSVALALAGLARFGRDGVVTETAGRGAIPPPLRPTPIAGAPSRFAASAWLIARGGRNGTLLGGQLGGSQAGARLTYALGSARKVALAARVATPLSGRGREAAVGVEWQPTRAPVRLVAEQRVSLDGGKGGPTLMAIGGIAPTPIAGGFRLESYAQAGVIARDGAEAFADGAARLARPLASIGGGTLDLGGGVWGGAQRGAARLDIGPSLGLVVPVGRRAVRLTLDYRARVAGEARPGSGVALSIGSDF